VNKSADTSTFDIERYFSIFRVISEITDQKLIYVLVRTHDDDDVAASRAVQSLSPRLMIGYRPLVL